jgi:hypothetical protein
MIAFTPDSFALLRSRCACSSWNVVESPTLIRFCSAS